MIDLLRRLIFVKKCVFCREILVESRESVLCPGCRAEYERILRLYCSMCGKRHAECRCSPPRLYADVDKTLHLMPYSEPLVRQMIYALKRKNDRTLRSFLVGELAYVIRNAGIPLSDLDITYAPRLPRSVREHGFDQAYKLAESLGRSLSIPMRKLFVHKHRSTLQKNLSAAERALNAEQSYCLRRWLPKKRGKRLMIVDDVITSGSTMAKLASLARTLGYQEIIVVCVARSIWRKG